MFPPATVDVEEAYVFEYPEFAPTRNPTGVFLFVFTIEVNVTIFVEEDANHVNDKPLLELFIAETIFEATVVVD